jgi:hypothetical protein
LHNASLFTNHTGNFERLEKMEDISGYILVPIGMTILFMVPSILLDAWLCKIGMIRSNKNLIIIFVIFMVLFKPFMFKDWSWWAFGIVLLLGQFGLHRYDLGVTIKKGKWWWLPKKRKKKHSIPK